MVSSPNDRLDPSRRPSYHLRRAPSQILLVPMTEAAIVARLSMAT